MTTVELFRSISVWKCGEPSLTRSCRLARCLAFLSYCLTMKVHHHQKAITSFVCNVLLPIKGICLSCTPNLQIFLWSFSLSSLFRLADNPAKAVSFKQPRWWLRMRSDGYFPPKASSGKNVCQGEYGQLAIAIKGKQAELVSPSTNVVWGPPI